MIVDVLSSLCIIRRRLAGAEHGTRVSQGSLNCRCERMRATHHAPGRPFRLLERRHGLAEIVERGGGVFAECTRVDRPHLERDIMILSVNASRHGLHFAQ